MKKYIILISLPLILIVIIFLLLPKSSNSKMEESATKPNQELDKIPSTSSTWADTFRFAGKDYINSHQIITKERISVKIGEIEKSLADKPVDPDHQMKDGEATFLPIGTVLYQIKGIETSEKIAVYISGKYYIYKVINN